MRRVREYLQIPDDYEGNRYSLSWSASGDAVERPDGTAFAFASQIAAFLEGYVLIGPLIHFSYILYLLQRFDARLSEPDEPGMTRTGPGRELVQKSDALAIAFREAGQSYPNAGALCAWLCRDIPQDPDPPDALELCIRLSNGALMSELAVRQCATSRLAVDQELPTLGALEFEIRFLNALKRLSPGEIGSWLRHGRPPIPAVGERVAQAIEALRPKSLEGALAAIAGRERLAGAVPMVAQLVAALTLPPRRLAHRALPTGGYADIATRGRPEQILPSQFAIDDVEFLRRFAENELLYFHREEPHAPVTEELVLLLDQGVRTWGRVRHALAASALAFGKLAARRGLALLVGSTGSQGRLIDPLTSESDALGVFWEATDLTPNPSRALERVLEARPGATRDVVVLSHPRSVAEPEFAGVAHRASPGTRVFSVTIDEPGAVQFREWRRGVPVKVGDFRVDFTPSTVTGAARSVPGVGDPRGWRGDVEPVGFPFRFGVVHRIDRPLFDFDHGVGWLLLCTHRGMLHAWKLDGTRAEVLPRAVVGGEVLEQVEAVLGVADGFVVCGRIGKSLVAMHYNFAGRVGRAQVLGPTFDGQWEWFYSRASHTVVARGRTYSRSLDLSTAEVFLSRETRTRPSARAIRAFEMAANHALPPPGLAIVDEATPAPDRGRSVELNRTTGEVHLEGESPPWDDFIPVSDGRPSLVGCWVDHAQLRGGVLALLLSGPGRGAKASLRLFHHPDGVPSRELTPVSSDPGSFILSEDGKLIARRVGERQLEVRETSGAGQPLLVTGKGKTHQDLKLTLGRYGMVIHVGKHVNLIRWDRGRLDIATIADGSTRSEFEVIPWAIDRPAGRSIPRPELLDYDPRRFVSCARAGLTAVVDVFGQVALFDASDRLLAMFVAFRSQVAAWMPDGTRLGPWHGASPLIDGPPTPGADERIGRVLKDASDASTGRQ
jgi:hypothetical protein